MHLQWRPALFALRGGKRMVDSKWSKNFRVFCPIRFGTAMSVAAKVTNASSDPERSVGEDSAFDGITPDALA
jgi:hypothetical protein